MDKGGAIVMGDIWDYRLRKLEIAWELAQRIIPAKVQESGAWMGQDNYLKKAQEVMTRTQEIVNTVYGEIAVE